MERREFLLGVAGVAASGLVATGALHDSSPALPDSATDEEAASPSTVRIDVVLRRE